VDCLFGQFADEFSFAHDPVEAFDLVAQDNSAHRQSWRQRCFEWIPFDLICHGTEECKAGFLIVAFRRKHDGWTASGLFVARLWVEMQPDDVSALGHVTAWHYQTS